MLYNCSNEAGPRLDSDTDIGAYSLTGSLYSTSTGEDNTLYAGTEPNRQANARNRPRSRPLRSEQASSLGAGRALPTGMHRRRLIWSHCSVIKQGRLLEHSQPVRRGAPGVHQ